MQPPEGMDVSATIAESNGPLAGDELLPRTAHQSTRAVTIDAPPAQAWRALESILHCGPIHPGDTIKAGPPGHPNWTVAAVEFARSIVLQAPGATWAFQLRPLDAGKGTRLVVRTRMPDDIRAVLIDTVELAFERRMLLGLRERAERAELS